MIKNLIILALSLSIPLMADARRYEYVSRFGDKCTTVIWSEEHNGGKIYLSTVNGSQKDDYVIAPDYKTERWHRMDASAHTDLTVSLNSDIYSISGTFKGKRISQRVKSKGKPWYQNIAYNAGRSLKGKKSLDYECFRPDNINLYTMKATRKGLENFNGADAVCIKVSLTGMLSVFWSCQYFFNPTSLTFSGYKGVNGGPGTPETIITLRK